MNLVLSGLSFNLFANMKFSMSFRQFLQFLSGMGEIFW